MSYLIAFWIIGIVWLLISIRNDALVEDWNEPTLNLGIICLYFIILGSFSAFMPVRDYKEIEVPFETFEFKDKTYYVNEAGKSYVNGTLIEKDQKVYETSKKSLFGLKFNGKIIK